MSDIRDFAARQHDFWDGDENAERREILHHAFVVSVERGMAQEIVRQRQVVSQLRQRQGVYFARCDACGCEVTSDGSYKPDAFTVWLHDTGEIDCTGAAVSTHITGVCAAGDHRRCNHRFLNWDGSYSPCECKCHGGKPDDLR